MVMTSKDDFKNVMREVADELGLDNASFDIMTTTGYWSAMMQELFENLNLHVADIKQEAHVSTAKKMDTLLKMAKNSSLSLDFAKPAKASFIISMKLGDVINASTEENGNYIFIIEKDTTYINLDGKPFSFDYDVKIHIIPEGDRYRYNAYYFAEGYTNPLDTENTLGDPIACRWDKDANGNDMLHMSIELKQYMRNEHISKYFTTQDNSVKDFAFNSQLAEFNVFTKSKSYSEPRQISKTAFFDKTSIDQETVFYKFSSVNTVSVLTRREGNFIPQNGSELVIEVFETMGSEGNFIYKGTNISVDFEDHIIANVVSLGTDPIGGEDSIDEDELRRRIIFANSTRGSIINDKDLKAHYSEGIYKIDKTRHDFFENRYNVTVALLDPSNLMYIHTNTLKVQTRLSDMKKIYEDRYFIVPDEIISYSHGLGSTYPKTTDNVLRYLYRVPFKVTFDIESGYVELYERRVMREYYVATEWVNTNTHHNNLINKIKFSKNPFSSYKISFMLMTSLNIEDDIELHKYTDGIIEDLGLIKIRMVLKNRGVEYGYIECKMKAFDDDNAYEFAIQDFLNEDVYGDRVIVYMKDISSSSYGNDISLDLPITNLGLDVYTFVKDDNVGVDTKFTDITGYSLTNIYKVEDVDLYKNLSHMASIKTIRPNTNDLTLTNVPVVGDAMYVATPLKVHDILDQEVAKLDSIYEQTESNFTQSLSLANTYGLSRKYKLGINQDTDLNQLSVDISINVKLAKKATTTELDIVDTVKGYFRSLDFNNGDFFHASKIEKLLLDTYSDIMFVEFSGINSLPPSYQLLSLVSGISSSEAVPEIININHSYSYDVEDYVPHILINILG